MWELAIAHQTVSGLARPPGGGGQDRHNACEADRKAIYLLPLTKQWRLALHSSPSRPLTLPPPQQEQDDLAEHEFGRVDFVGGRLRGRLLTMAHDFYAQPEAGSMDLHMPGKGGSKSRTANLVILHIPVKLRPPRGNKGEALNLWAVHAIEPTSPAGNDAIECLRLTTVPVEDYA